MGKQFKQWPPKIKRSKWWVMGAIATPVFLAMMWLLPERRLQPDEARLSSSQSAPVVHQNRETLINLATIAAVAGGVFLFLNFRRVDPSEAAALSEAALSGTSLSGIDLSGAELNCAELSNANLNNANLSGADLSSADLSNANLNGANLNGANLYGANLSGANLSSADLSNANLKYANLSGADLSSANLCRADFRYANLSGADLNCTVLRGANFSEANLSEAMLFFINSRDVLNLEPLQLKAQPSPFLCNVALPAYSQQTNVDPNRDCGRIPQLLSTRYDISLEEAQGIVNEARQHRWD